MPYPRKLSQGWLDISPDVASWSPYWSLRRNPVTIGPSFLTIASRPADDREPNVKKEGKAFGVIEIPAFTVMSCASGDSSVDLVVPPGDEQLVLGYLRSGLANGSS